MKRHPIIEGDITYIPLTQNSIAIIDTEDLPLIQHYSWSYNAQIGKVIANIKGIVYLHRYIMGVKDKNDEIIAQNGSYLDCRKSNLCYLPRMQQTWLRPKHSDNTSGYKGVFRDAGKWRASIYRNGKKINLGRYESIVDAALAYAVADKVYREGCWIDLR